MRLMGRTGISSSSKYLASEIYKKHGLAQCNLEIVTADVDEPVLRGILQIEEPAQSAGCLLGVSNLPQESCRFAMILPASSTT